MRTPALLADPDDTYQWTPSRLLDQHYDNPLAIGAYAFVARLWLAAGCPEDGVPLSDADFGRFDPRLASRGALLRALQRLLDGGWVRATRARGAKTRYTPAWGFIRGVLRPWSKAASSLNRGRVHTIRVSTRLLDDYVGRLIPHPKAPALVERFQTTARLSLRDVGVYILRRRHQTTVEAPALEDTALCHAETSLAVPPTEDTLARAELTTHGMRRLGMISPSAAARPVATDGRPPVYVADHQMIGLLIGQLIPPLTLSKADSCPAAQDESDVGPEKRNVTGMLSMQRKKNPPTPTDQGGGRLGDFCQDTDRPGEDRMTTHPDADTPCPDRPRGRRRRVMSIPQTPAAQHLWGLGARPEACIELADLDLALVERAIADGNARPKVYDLAGWTISLLRDVRDHGWDLALIKRGTPPSNGGPSLTEIQDSIAKAKASGTFLTDDTLDTAPEAPLATSDSPLAEPAIDATTAALLAQAQASGFCFGDREDGPIEAPSTPDDADPHRPAWLPPVLWAGVPAPMQRLLWSAQRVGRTVRAIDAQTQAELERRFGRELAALLRALDAPAAADTAPAEASAPALPPVVLSTPAPAARPCAADRRPPTRRVAPPTSAGAKPDASRPVWITDDDWMALSPVLRGILRGATLVDGQVVAADPWRQGQLAKFPLEIAALVAAALPAR